MSQDRPARLDQGTANLSQPWVFVVLAAVHLGCLAIIPSLASGPRRAVALTADAIAAVTVAAVLFGWARRRRRFSDPVIVAVLTVAFVAAGVRMVALGTPWGGLDVVLVVIGTTTLRDRRVFTAVAVAGLLAWGAVTGVGWWRYPGPGASWLVGWGMAGAVAGLVAVMRAGIVTLERTLEEVRRDADAQAVRDALTGVANRQGLEMLALPMIENARREGAAVHCLYIDIDAFAAVNAAAGDGAGDEVLIALAEALKTSVRGTDAVARWSGDEFVVLGPGTGTSPLELERRLRTHLQQVSPVADQVWSARVSIGSATLVPWDDGNLDSLLDRAEQDMRLRRTLRRRSGEQPRPRATPPQRPVAGRADD